jgi:hypothetical protein
LDESRQVGRVEKNATSEAKMGEATLPQPRSQRVLGGADHPGCLHDAQKPPIFTSCHKDLLIRSFVIVHVVVTYI